MSVEYYKDLLRMGMNREPETTGHLVQDSSHLWYLAQGIEIASTGLAIWNDGEQYVGVLRHPLRGVVKEIHEARRELARELFGTGSADV